MSQAFRIAPAAPPYAPEIQARFDRIWSGAECARCKLRRECPKPLDLLDRKAPPANPNPKPSPNRSLNPNRSSIDHRPRRLRTWKTSRT